MTKVFPISWGTGQRDNGQRVLRYYFLYEPQNSWVHLKY